ncbi:MAG: YdcF family protein [Bacteroidia bacterium]
MLRKILISIAVLFLFLFIIFLLRTPILKAAGNYLIKEDLLEKSEAIFVLSGDPYDRGRQAQILFEKGYAPVVIATGENVSHNLKALGIDYAESDLTRHYLINNGMDSTYIVMIRKGTSTIEEASVIIDYAKVNSLNKVIVVSSLFHTRRIHAFYHPLFKKANIDLIVQGAPSSLYNEQEWWTKEDGMIMVNNEYVKLAFYSIKY